MLWSDNEICWASFFGVLIEYQVITEVLKLNFKRLFNINILWYFTAIWVTSFSLFVSTNAFENFLFWLAIFLFVWCEHGKQVQFLGTQNTSLHKKATHSAQNGSYKFYATAHGCLWLHNFKLENLSIHRTWTNIYSVFLQGQIINFASNSLVCAMDLRMKIQDENNI